MWPQAMQTGPIMPSRQYEHIQVGIQGLMHLVDEEGQEILDTNSIRLTEGRHRTICVSRHLPECLKRPDDVWALEQFELLDELYRGKTSLLHKAVDKASGQRVAIKQYRKKCLSSLNRYQVEREVRIHITLLHRNIITLHAAFEDPEQVYLVQEFAPGGDLFEALKHAPSMVFSEAEAVSRFMAPCLDAMAYLQDRGIIHRDIKPENILLGDNGDVKLADFGLAINCDQERPVTRAGTLDYMAPEVLVCPDKRRPDENKDKASLSYNRQVDAWALGCLAAELVTGSPPFEADSRSVTYQMIMYREPRLPAYLSQAARSFIAASLVKAPAERSTVYQMLQHEWISTNRGAFAVKGDVAAVATIAPSSANSSQSQAGIDIDSNGLALCNDQGSTGLTDMSSQGSTSMLDSSGAKVTAADPQCNSSTAAGVTELSLRGSSTDTQSSPVAEGAYAGAGVPAVIRSSSSGTQAAASTGGLAAAVRSNDVMQPIGLIAAAEGDARLCGGQQASVSQLAVEPMHQQQLQQLDVDSTPAVPVSLGAALEGSASGSMLAGGGPSQPAAAFATFFDPVSAPSPEQSADGQQAGSRSRHAKGKLPRPSSGHHLHKIFYPRDKHRRSSYSNMQWDDFIETSSHSFTGSVHSAGAGAMGLEDLADQQVLGGNSNIRGSSSGGSEAGVELRSPFTQGLSSPKGGRSSHIGHRGSQQSVLLAALPDAELQAPAAVKSDVMAKTASGALHLLAANDLEDLIAPTITPSRTLTTLGLVIPAVADAVAVSSPSSIRMSSARSRRISAIAVATGDETTAAAAAESILTGGNLDDFIATSAAPASRLQRSFVVAGSSKSSSVPNLLSLAAGLPGGESPPAAAAVVRPDSSVAMVSPRTRHASLIGAAQHNGASPRPPPGARPILQARSGMSLNLMTQGLEGDDISSGADSGRSSALDTPAASRKVLWADETPVATPKGLANHAVAGLASASDTRQGESFLSSPLRSKQAQLEAGSMASSESSGQRQQLPLANQQQAPQYYAPPSGVLSSGVALTTPRTSPGFKQSTGGRTSGGILDGAVSPVPRSRSSAAIAQYELSPAAVALMQQQHDALAPGRPEQHILAAGRRRISSSEGSSGAKLGARRASRRSSSEDSIGQNSSSEEGGSARHSRSKGPFSGAVPFGALSKMMGLQRNSINSKTLPNALQLPGEGGLLGVQAAGEPDMADLAAARSTSKSFTAGMARNRSSGALTPTKPSFPVVVGSLKAGSFRSSPAADIASNGKRQ